MELIVVLCKESSHGHEVCDRCPVHQVHTEIPVGLVCLDPSDDVAQQLKVLLEEKFRKKGTVFDPRLIRFGTGG